LQELFLSEISILRNQTKIKMENASIKLMRKESILLIDDANDFIYNERGLLIGVSKGK